MEKTLRILIIEDSEDDTLLLMRHLRRDGYSPLHKRVDSMEEVETALNTQTWDIVISDYVLPHFSGLEALRLVQKKDPDLPCIIVSGRITDETAVAAMKSGARDYIMKDSLKRIGVAIERELAETEARRERKRAQEQLREVSEKLYLVTETIQDAFWMSSPVDGGIAYLSPAFEDIWDAVGFRFRGYRRAFWKQYTLKTARNSWTRVKNTLKGNPMSLNIVFYGLMEKSTGYMTADIRYITTLVRW